MICSDKCWESKNASQCQLQCVLEGNSMQIDHSLDTCEDETTKMCLEKMLADVLKDGESEKIDDLTDVTKCSTECPENNLRCILECFAKTQFLYDQIPSESRTWPELVKHQDSKRIVALEKLGQSLESINCPLFSECYNGVGKFECICSSGLTRTDYGACTANNLQEIPSLVDLSDQQLIQSPSQIIQNSGYPYGYGLTENESRSWVVQVKDSISYSFKMIDFALDESCHDILKFSAGGNSSISLNMCGEIIQNSNQQIYMTKVKDKITFDNVTAVEIELKIKIGATGRGSGLSMIFESFPDACVGEPCKEINGTVCVSSLGKSSCLNPDEITTTTTTTTIITTTTSTSTKTTTFSTSKPAATSQMMKRV